MSVDRRFHLLITPTYFEKCHEYGLFGVSEANMNQLANVSKGDIAFFYTTLKLKTRTVGRIYGPCEVMSNLFYNDELVWASSSADPHKDKYPYRIKLKLLDEHICLNPVPIQTLWDLKDEGKIKSIMDSSALINKAVCNLLTEEGILLLQSLIQANQIPGADDSPYKGHSLTEHNVEVFKFRGRGAREFRMESYLETYLLLNQSKLHQLSGFPIGINEEYQTYVLNQVSTYVAGGAIDIVCLYKKTVIDVWLILSAAVFELKKGILEPTDLDQLIEYIEWAARLIPGCKREMTRGILVGRDFANQGDKCEALLEYAKEIDKIYKIDIYEYRIDELSQNVIFDKIS